MNNNINPNSQKLSQLSVSQISPDDWIIISTSGELQNGERTGRRSYKMKYSDFRNAVLKRLDQIIGVKSMAYEDKGRFAQFRHGHPYSDSRFFPSYGPDSENPACVNSSDDCIKIGEFRSVFYGPDNTKSVCQRQVCVPKKNGNLTNGAAGWSIRNVGDIQTICVNKLRTYLTSVRGYRLTSYSNGYENIDINHSGFDGYVIPNGTTFTVPAAKFRKACQLWAGSPNATSFTVPNITGFLRANNNTDSTLNSNEMKSYSYSNKLQSHAHDAAGTNNKISVDVTIPPFKQRYTGPGNNLSNYNALHISQSTEYVPPRGSENLYPTLSVYFLSLTNIGTISDTCTSSPDDLDIESYPAFNYMPALIYIGKADE